MSPDQSLLSPGYQTGPRLASNAAIEGLGRWLVAAYVLTLGMQFELVAAGRFAPSDAFLAIFILLYWDRIRIVAGTWTVFHFGMLIVFIIGTFLAASKWGTLTTYVLVNKDIGLLLLFAGYVVCVFVTDNWARTEWVLRMYIHGVFIQCAIALGVYLAYKLTGFSTSWVNYGDTRISGMLVDPNAFGGYAATGLVIHGCTYFSRRPLISGFRGIIYSMVMAMALMLTLSRSAWIGFALALLITLPFRPRMGFAYAGILLVTALLIAFVLGDRVNEVIALADRRNTAQQRIEQIILAIPMIAQAPWFGSGISVFRDTHGVLIHNTTVWILTEFGLVGLFVYLGFLGNFFLRGYQTFRRLDFTRAPLVLSLLAAHACILGVSAGIEALYQRHWWLVFACIASTSVIARGSQMQNEQLLDRI